MKWKRSVFRRCNGSGRRRPVGGRIRAAAVPSSTIAVAGSQFPSPDRHSPGVRGRAIFRPTSPNLTRFRCPARQFDGGLLAIVVTRAGIQDRAGACQLLRPVPGCVLHRQHGLGRQRRSGLAPYAFVMPAGARKLVLVGFLVAVALTSCTPGTVPVASSSSSADLPAGSRPDLPSTTTPPPSQSASPTPQNVRPSWTYASTVTPSPPPNNDQVRLARPLHLPVLHPGQACPVSPETGIHDSSDFTGPALGVGPVHPLALPTEPLISNTNQAPGWLAMKSLWVSDPRYQGPFLVRIRRLDGSGPAGVLEDPTMTSFFVPDGPTFNSEPGGYRAITGATWVKTPGCVAWQVDGLTFSNVIVIRLLCRPPLCVLSAKR